MRHHFAGIRRRLVSFRRQVDVQLDAALPGRLEIVGIDLDLVGQRGEGRRRRQRKNECRDSQCAPFCRSSARSFFHHFACPVVP
jgi:hypothetical protein